MSITYDLINTSGTKYNVSPLPVFTMGVKHDCQISGLTNKMKSATYFVLSIAQDYDPHTPILYCKFEGFSIVDDKLTFSLTLNTQQLYDIIDCSETKKLKCEILFYSSNGEGDIVTNGEIIDCAQFSLSVRGRVYSEIEMASQALEDVNIPNSLIELRELAGNASTFAQSAQTSATNAEQSAQSALQSATNAQIYKLNAESNAYITRQLEISARQSSTNAQTSATNAQESATNAQTSETNAKTSETNAQQSATTASNAIGQLGAYSSFINTITPNKHYNIGDYVHFPRVYGITGFCVKSGTTRNYIVDNMLHPIVSGISKVSQGDTEFVLYRDNELDYQNIDGNFGICDPNRTNVIITKNRADKIKFDIGCTADIEFDIGIGLYCQDIEYTTNDIPSHKSFIPKELSLVIENSWTGNIAELDPYIFSEVRDANGNVGYRHTEYGILNENQIWEWKNNDLLKIICCALEQGLIVTLSLRGTGIPERENERQLFKLRTKAVYIPHSLNDDVQRLPSIPLNFINGGVDGSVMLFPDTTHMVYTLTLPYTGGIFFFDIPNFTSPASCSVEITVTGEVHVSFPLSQNNLPIKWENDDVPLMEEGKIYIIDIYFNGAFYFMRYSVFNS